MQKKSPCLTNENMAKGSIALNNMAKVAILSDITKLITQNLTISLDFLSDGIVDESGLVREPDVRWHQVFIDVDVDTNHRCPSLRPLLVLHKMSPSLQISTLPTMKSFGKIASASWAMSVARLLYGNA